MADDSKRASFPSFKTFNETQRERRKRKPAQSVSPEADSAEAEADSAEDCKGAYEAAPRPRPFWLKESAIIFFVEYGSNMERKPESTKSARPYSQEMPFRTIPAMNLVNLLIHHEHLSDIFVVALREKRRIESR